MHPLHIPGAMQYGDCRVKLLIHPRGDLPPLVSDDHWRAGRQYPPENLAEKIRWWMARVDEQFRDPLVGIVEQKQSASGIAITAGAANFLVIGFQGVRHVRMDDEAYVRPVNTHTERIRGDNDSGLARHESILHGLPVADGKSRVVGNSIDVMPAERTMDVFNVTPSAGIDDSRPAPGREFDNRLHFLANGRHFPNLEIEIRPIESADHLGRTFDTELLEDVRTNDRRRRCRQSDNRRLPKTVDS